MREFELTTLVDAPIEVVFDLARSIDAHIRSMPNSHERAIAGVRSGLIQNGEQVTWRTRHFGVSFTMTSEIRDMDPPHSFVDLQLRGPFRHFRHVHRFHASDSGTVMHDHVRFEAPLGVLGRVVEAAALSRYLEHLIAKRNDFLRAEAERSVAKQRPSEWPR